MRLIDGENTGPDAVNLKPFVRDSHPLQLAVFGARQVAAPLRFLAGQQRHQYKKQGCREVHRSPEKENQCRLRIARRETKKETPKNKKKGAAVDALSAKT